jgi:hypothetical protein
MNFPIYDTDLDSTNESSLLLYDDENDDDENDDGYITQEEDLDEDSFLSYEEMDDYSINTNEELLIDIIFEEESHFVFEEKIDKNYYIGMGTKIDNYDLLIMANSISITTFFKYPYNTLLQYLWFHSIIRVNKPTIDILKLIIQPDGSYSVVIKTFWLRVFQRRWKRIFREHQELIMKRKSIQYLKIREITGKFPL